MAGLIKWPPHINCEGVIGLDDGDIAVNQGAPWPFWLTRITGEAAQHIYGLIFVPAAPLGLIQSAWEHAEIPFHNQCGHQRPPLPNKYRPNLSSRVIFGMQIQGAKGI